MNENIEDAQTNDFDVSSQYASIFDGHQKKIDSTYELVFNITSHLMKQDDNGQDMFCEQVSGKNFHIPVKEGADPKVFMDTFFRFLEDALAKSAKHAYENCNEAKKND